MPALAALPRLLVVEEDAELLSIVQEFLEQDGYDVTPAASLPDSLAVLEEHLFQFVLTDLFYRPGRPLLHSIHPLLAQAAPTPVGVMTAWLVPEEDLEREDLAFLVPMPFDLDDLRGHLDAEFHPTIRSLRQTQLVEQFYQNLNARDWRQLTRLCAPTLRVTTPMGASNASIGLRNYLAILERRCSLLPGYTIEEVRVFPRQDGAAARYLARWQDSAGLEHRAAGSMRFHFQYGRIAQIDGAF
jgi:CheY-like chemotaxis protein